MAKWIDPADIPGPKGQEFMALAQEEWGEAIEALTSEHQGIPNLVSSLMNEIGYQCVRWRKYSADTPGQGSGPAPSPPEQVEVVTAPAAVTPPVILSAVMKALCVESAVEGMAPSELLELAESITGTIGESL